MPLTSPVTGHRLNWGNPAPDELRHPLTVSRDDHVGVTGFFRCQSKSGRTSAPRLAKTEPATLGVFVSALM
jgi:hypothetical protein